jgi:hypothetical protein
MNLLIPFLLCHPISLSSILILPSHLQIDLPCAVLNVCISVLHHTCHCSTSRKVAGSIPDGDIGIFHWHNPSGRTMFPGSTLLSIQMCTRNSLGGKGGRCVELTTYHLHVPIVLKSGSLNLQETSGLVKDCTGIFFFTFYHFTLPFFFLEFSQSFSNLTPSVISSYEVVTGMNPK